MSQERVWKEKAGIKTLARISSGGEQAFEGNRKRNRMGMQKFVSEDGSVGEKEAFVGEWAWNRKCREKSDGKRAGNLQQSG